MSADKKEKDKDAKPKKGKGMLLIGIGLLVMIGGGAGTAFALVKIGVIGGVKETKHEANVPKLLKKGDEDPYAPKAGEGGKEEAKGTEVEGEGGSAFRTAYYTFTDEFTSNLRDSASLVQMSIACSTHRDGRVLMWLKKHELAIRSAILVVLADTPDTDAHTAQGKDHLQKRLTVAINKVLTEEEGFGGVDQVYFRSFLVQ